MAATLPSVVSEPFYLKFWGKAGGDEAARVWHPAALHMLDVAAVAEAWLAANVVTVPGLGKEWRDSIPALVTLIAFHDVGKFSRPFQAKIPELWPACLGACVALKQPRHDAAGLELLRGPLFFELLQPLFGDMPEGERNFLLRAVCGHHGSPPQEEFRDSRIFCEVSRQAAVEFITDVLALLKPTPLPGLDDDEVTALAWWLAGVAVLADWVGSSERWFSYPVQQHSLSEYWPIARNRAQQAVAAAGLGRNEPSAALPMAALLSGNQPTPLQDFVARMVLPEGPVLAIVEDQTGSGKTEAALLLAHRLMQEKGAQGLFITLPTMATANALYARLEAHYRDLFAAKGAPSLVLAHGKRQLSDPFQQALRRGSIVSARSEEHDADETASSQCAAWIGSDRRRSFLAACGAGTIDQALHAVLPTRHAPLRLLGLSQRVLIIDEAHAYDEYMAEELRRLVEFQFKQGGSTIILSATLPRKTRDKLVRAVGIRARCQRDDYPLVTLIANNGVQEYPVAPRQELERRIEVHRLPDAEATLEQVVQAAERGAAVGWIRNSVDDAIAAHAALSARGIAATLFHARFAMGDRLGIEEVVQARFGKASTPETRAHVVIGTQVMEQSLDLDFDVMISDLAPVDLLLQRAGRLWRHKRERPVAVARLFVISPEPVEVPAAEWLRDFPRTGRVYGDHGLLWRSARKIFAQPILRLPEDVRPLVEAVYEDGADVPEGLAAASRKAEGQGFAARATAWQNLLRWRDGYAEGSAAWASDVRTPTRLSEPSCVFRLGVWENGRLSSCCEDADEGKAWAMSEISLPLYRAQSVPEETGVRAAALVLVRSGWSSWEQEIPVLILKAEGTGWSGTVLNAKGQEQAVRYNRQEGLIFDAIPDRSRKF